MFIPAAAERLDVTEFELVAANSIVTHPHGRSLTFGELAFDAAGVAVPDAYSVNSRSQGTGALIGKSVPRVDVPSKVDGSAVYGIDVTLPGLKHAAIAMRSRNW